MLNLIKLWLHAVFVSPHVRLAFWSVVGTVLTVEFPQIPDGVLPPWVKSIALILSGVMIPHVREFAKAQAQATLPATAIIQYEQLQKIGKEVK